jgi:hypothetical protein
MQKVVTVYLDNGAYKQDHMIVTHFADKHGLVEEHLGAYLQDGWTVKSITGFGGNSESLAVRGWLAVVLEK